MKLSVFDKANTSVKTLELPENLPVSHPATVAMVVQYLHNAMRATVAHTKDRGDVRGGGAKPWRQKGTGRARAGSSRSPIWRGGGVTFGPRSTDTFATRLPKKMYRQVLAHVLSQKLLAEKIKVIDTLPIKDGKTKEAFALIKELALDTTTCLVVTEEFDHIAQRAFANMPFVKLITVSEITILDLEAARSILFTEGALKIALQTILDVSLEEKPKAAAKPKTKTSEKATA